MPISPGQAVFTPRFKQLQSCKALAGLLVLGILPFSWVSAQQATVEQALSVGAYFGRGDFGETVKTRINYYPLTYEYNRDAWGLQLTVPHLRVNGLGNVLVNVGGVTRAVAGESMSSQHGLGDTVVTGIYRLQPWSETAPFLDLRLNVKLPTADENKSLGTGETDYSLQVDLTQAWGSTVLFGTAGYQWRGDSELFVGLADGAFAQLGFAQPLGSRVNAGIYYDFRQAASQFSVESHELLPYISWQLNDSWSLTGMGIWGFTEASADTAVLGQLRYSW